MKLIDVPQRQSHPAGPAPAAGVSRKVRLTVLSSFVLPFAVATAGLAQTVPLSDRPSAPPEVVSTAARHEAGLPEARTAEHPPAPRRSLFSDIAQDFGRFFTSSETYGILGVGLATSLSAGDFDQRVASSPFNSHRPGGGSGAWDEAFDAGATLGGFGVQAGAALAAYGAGAWLERPGLREFGRDLVRAQVLTQGVTQAIKYAVQRTRPDGSSDTSFPSGHASSAFATATVIEQHYGWKAGAPAYALAAYVAASRVNENRHYVSDVVFGAAVGLAAGRTIRMSVGSTRLEISPLIAPAGAGVSVAVGR